MAAQDAPKNWFRVEALITDDNNRDETRLEKLIALAISQIGTEVDGIVVFRHHRAGEFLP